MKSYIKFLGYNLLYDEWSAAQQTINEIKNSDHYYFRIKNENPFVIDAGANIGVATCYFKSIYPEAQIICFEPDPGVFSLLQKNINNNLLTQIELVNGALYNESGKINFYGQINRPDARGNSILKDWGAQRVINDTIQVESKKLSSYITKPVDLLKLDIEGVEQIVLEELVKANKLNWINHIAMEVHCIKAIEHVNKLDNIINMLEPLFKIEIIEKNIKNLLPDAVKTWSRQHNPRLFSLKAIKNN